MRLEFKKAGEGVLRDSPGRRGVTPPLHQRRRETLVRVGLLEAYREFFDFEEPPFSVSPNPRCFYASSSHAEALDHLRYGIYEGLGFTMITGEAGSGKTMLLKYFLSQAGDDLTSIEIPDPRLSPRDLLLEIHESLGASKSPGDELSEARLTGQLRNPLLLAHSQLKKVVVLLDEAQGLDSQSLEGLRLLSNLETENQKLIQIVLFGQSELEGKLRERGLRQLDQRILVRYRLRPLEPPEILPYIQHQLAAANVDLTVEFGPQSVSKIYEISGGLPRMVNVLGERAMMSAFIEGTTRIQLPNVLEAWESLEGVEILEREKRTRE